MSLLDACGAQYGLEGYALRPLLGGVSDHTYLLERPGSESFVLRVERANLDDMPIHERVLLYLEERGYPAPRVVRAVDGSPFIQHEDARLVLTSHIDGVIVESDANTPETLYRMGGILGRLHSLGPVPDDLPGADFMPQNRVTWAEERLSEVADRVPTQWRFRVYEMLDTLASTPSLAELPTCLIHNDSHPGNAVCGHNGEVTLIDWDGAGRGATVLDLGFLLIAADTYTEDVPVHGDSTSRVNAIVDGYCKYRLLEAAELERLADAIRFRVTFINAATFARQAERRELDQLPVSWWHGCDAAEELASRVQRRFDEHE